jgi:acetone carboxylase beta subunit
MTTKRVQVIGSDAGGTMTDIFLVDTEGNFAVGKAPTTPRDESLGFWESVADAAEHWDIDWQSQARSYLPFTELIIYSGTAMLNVLLTRTGKRLGVIITKGHEDTLLHERGSHVFAGYGYSDRLHKVTHQHNVPLVPRKLIRGATERINLLGEPVIPLYERDVRQAAEELIDMGVEGIVILFLYSYLNPLHEQEAAEVVREVMRDRGIELPLYLSCEVSPISREVSRLCSTLLQGYAAEPARGQLLRINDRLRDAGYRYPLQIVLSSGSVADIRYPRLHEATFSGAIGGLMGVKYLAQMTGISNWVASDMGGTSFDVGLIRGGQPIIRREVALAHHLFNIPTVVMDSVGAGTGQYLRIDPLSKRLEIGPESAGAEPGPVCYNLGNETPTVMDCCLILGLLNPDYYLGGKMKLHTDLALRAVKENCADVLGVDVYQFASGVIQLINSRMREHVRTVLAVRGFSAADYHLLGYGGAGPLFLASYAEGLPFQGVATVPYAAAFSSFGCAAMDFAHRYQKSILIQIPYQAEASDKQMFGEMLNMGWDDLEQLATRDLEAEGIDPGSATFQPIAYLRYGLQLEDLEVLSPVRRIHSAEDMDQLLQAFEDLYTSIYTAAARYPEAGYTILEQGLRVSVSARVKPYLPRFPLEGKRLPPEAVKGERQVYWGGCWQAAGLYEMDLLRPGNEVEGIAIIEAPATTLVVPPGKKIRMDELKIIWLE